MSYAVVSDIHAHAWTLFARTDPDGVNSRLRLTLNELERAATTLVNHGGDTMVIAGDILHTRGTIDPEVLNPLRASVERILDMGITIHAIPGNHDLKSAETNELASAIQNLAQVSNTGGVFKIHNDVKIVAFGPHRAAFIPWRNTREQLLRDIEDVSDHQETGRTDLFIHAGIDGVISGMPASGLTHGKLGSFGFRNIFAGHYHNHKDFGNGVTSIGATTHQNWGDVGTRAGFLIVNDDGSFTHHPSQAPSFIDISGMSETDMELSVAGNYARYRGAAMTEDQITELRDVLRGWGALGTSIEVPRQGSVLRSTAPASTARTTEQSIEAFVTAAPPANPAVSAADVVRRSIEVLHESQAVAA